jgi:hypothetical protein
MATSALSMQNYFSTTLSAPLNATTDTVIYLNALPNASEGYLEIDEGTAQKEIIYYTSKGGSFVTCPSFALGRGIGGTSASAHASGAVVKQKVNAEYWKNIQDGSALNTNAIAADKLATTAITLGYTQVTSNFATASTSPADVTSLTVTVTIPSGGRRIKITAFMGRVSASVANCSATANIYDVTAGAQLTQSTCATNASGDSTTLCPMASHAPAAGSRTYKVQFWNSGNAATVNTNASATIPAFILVEAI